MPKVSLELVRGKAESRSLFFEMSGWAILSTEIVFCHLEVAQDCSIPFSLVEFSWHYPSCELKKMHSNFVTDLLYFKKLISLSLLGFKVNLLALCITFLGGNPPYFPFSRQALNPSLYIKYPPDLDRIPHTPTRKFSHSL